MPSDRIPALHQAVLARSVEIVRELIASGADPHEGIYPFREFTSALDVAKERGYAEIVAAIESTERPARKPPVDAPDSGITLWECAGTGDYESAKRLLDGGADPNEAVYAGGSPMFRAFSQGDRKMIALLRKYGGAPEATTAGLLRLTSLARQMLAGEAAYRLDGVGGQTLPEQLLWGAACGGDPETVRMALELVDWPRNDPRWFEILEQPLRVWSFGSVSDSWDRSTYPVCFGLLLKRCDPNIAGRFGVTILHSVAGSRRHVTVAEQLEFARLLLDAGARLDIRDALFDKTALGWAEMRNREELVELYRSHVSYPPFDSA
jgi:ankyrin repeat protein